MESPECVRPVVWGGLWNASMVEAKLGLEAERNPPLLSDGAEQRSSPGPRIKRPVALLLRALNSAEVLI